VERQRVALQEVRAETLEGWRAELADAGLKHFVSTHEVVGERWDARSDAGLLEPLAH
jgi:hypothetical protein